MLAVSVDFHDETACDIQPKPISDHLEIALRRLGVEGRLVIEVKLVSNQTITQLNKGRLGHDEPTDVLSFPLASETRGKAPTLLGSIVIATDVAATQAKAAGISLIDEVKTLAGHGLLHLTGYHHS